MCTCGWHHTAGVARDTHGMGCNTMCDTYAESHTGHVATEPGAEANKASASKTKTYGAALSHASSSLSQSRHMGPISH